MELFFLHFFIASKFDDIFFSDFFFILLESSEMHFNVIANKKIHNIIYGDIVVHFLRILSTKSTILQKHKMQRSENCLFIGFRTLRIFWEFFFGHFGWFILVKFLTILCRKSTISHEIKIGKLFFNTMLIFLDQKPNMATFEGKVVN